MKLAFLEIWRRLRALKKDPTKKAPAEPFELLRADELLRKSKFYQEFERKREEILRNGLRPQSPPRPVSLADWVWLTIVLIAVLLMRFLAP